MTLDRQISDGIRDKFLIDRSRFYDCKYLLERADGEYFWGEMVHSTFKKIASVDEDRVEIHDIDKVISYIRNQMLGV